MILSKLTIVAIVLLVLASQSSIASAQPSSKFDVIYRVDLAQHSSLFSTVAHRIFLNVAGRVMSGPSPVRIHVTFRFQFLGFSNLPQGANSTLAVASQHPLVNVLDVQLPPSTSTFNFTIRGKLADYSLLWRTVATIPFTDVVANFAPNGPASYKLLIPQPSGQEVVSLYPDPGTALVFSHGSVSVITHQVLLGGQPYLLTDFPSSYVSMDLIYQPVLRDLFLFFYLGLVAALIILLPLLRKRLRFLTVNHLNKVVSSGTRLLGWFTTRHLLELFAAVAALMIGLSLLLGPLGPPKIYVSATPDTVARIGPYITKSGFTYLTPLDAGDQFDTMSSLGNYYAVVIADYPIPFNSIGVSANYRIFLMSNYLSSGYVSTFQAVYHSTLTGVTVAKSDSDLARLLSGLRVYVPGNRFGLSLSPFMYNVIGEVEGVLALIITFLALAFLSRSLMEIGEKGLTGLAEGGIYVFATFMFTTMVFIQTTVLLDLPVALHAAISSNESAMGLLGFGGGSRPRELMGLLGFVFGVLSVGKGRIKLDKIGLLAFLGIVFFLATDTLNLGQTFYAIFLNLTTSEGGGIVGRQTEVGFRNFLEQMMFLFGRFVSTNFYSSHGATLYFFAALPFVIYSKLRKTSATLLLLFSSFGATVGFIRVADLNAAEALASAPPGLAMGLLAIPVLVILSVLETRIRRILT